MYTDGFDGTGPGDTVSLLKEIQVASDFLKKEFSIGDMRSEFESKYRPLLASNCLLVPHELGHIRTAFLHGQMHGFTKQKTLHLTSLDVMLRLKTLKELQKKPFIDFLIERRVLVHEDWQHNYGNIEMLEYHFEESDNAFVRAEYDASFKSS